MDKSDIIQQYIDNYGIGRVLSALEQLDVTEQEATVLTIISNKGIHHLPKGFERGTIFVASEGNLDFSSIQAVERQYVSILAKLAEILKSRNWSKIYLIPFGHSTLTAQIKLLVFRVTRLETIDMFYDGRGNYYDLEIAQRTIIIESSKD